MSNSLVKSDTARLLENITQELECTERVEISLDRHAATFSLHSKKGPSPGMHHLGTVFQSLVQLAAKNGWFVYRKLTPHKIEYVISKSLIDIAPGKLLTTGSHMLPKHNPHALTSGD